MGDNYFDLITREVLKQKERKEHLEEENRELRQQLADLRAGCGVVVEVEGKRFELTIPMASLSTTTDQENVASLNTLSDASSPTSTSLPIVAAQSSIVAPIEEKKQEPVMEQADETMQATEASKRYITKKLTASIPEASHTALELTEEETAPTFLEEAMIDEFTTATTSPLAVWSGPPAPHAPKKREEIDEEEKAALRRQLIGSFLLE